MSVITEKQQQMNEYLKWMELMGTPVTCHGHQINNGWMDFEGIFQGSCPVCEATSTECCNCGHPHAMINGTASAKDVMGMALRCGNPECEFYNSEVM